MRADWSSDIHFNKVLSRPPQVQVPGILGSKEPCASPSAPASHSWVGQAVGADTQGLGSRRSLRNASLLKLLAGRTNLEALAVSGQPAPTRLAVAPAETKMAAVISVYPLQLFCGLRWVEVFFQMISYSLHSQVLRGTHWCSTDPGNWVSEKQSYARLINSRIEVQAGV